jgi:SAM-dependent methyltransferase
VLDLGCGTGLFIEYLGMTDPDHYMGMDISPGMLLRFADKFPDVQRSAVPGRHGKPGRTWFQTALTIVVSFFGPISHCWDHLKVYRHIHRVLKPGGKVFIQAYSARYPERASYIFNR